MGSQYGNYEDFLFYLFFFLILTASIAEDRMNITYAALKFERTGTRQS